jgi:hypothetical protein
MMKKVFSVAITALLAMSLMFTSCSKEDEKEDTLDGTSWSFAAEDLEIGLSFTKSRFTMTFDIEGESETIDGTYTYSKPKVTLVAGEGVELEGTVDGNKLRVDLSEYAGYNLELLLTKD